MPLILQAEVGGGGGQEIEFQILLVDHPGDVSEVFLMSSFTVKFEFVKNHVFGRCDGDLSGWGEYALLVFHRPFEIGMVL